MARPDVGDLQRLLGEAAPEAQERLSDFAAPFVIALAEQIVAEAGGYVQPAGSTADLRSVLASAINRLPEREKIVLTLLYYERLSLQQVAQVLGVSRPSIANHRQRALRHLRNELVHSRLLTEEVVDQLANEGRLLPESGLSPTDPVPETTTSTSRFSEERLRRRRLLAHGGLLVETEPTAVVPPKVQEFRAAELEAGRGRPLADYVSEGRN
jgi:DNA-binding CsgD family transcriptional regulator